MATVLFFFKRGSIHLLNLSMRSGGGMPLSCAVVDLVGVRGDGLIAVELKKSLTTNRKMTWRGNRTTVLDQANRNRNFAHLSYCAVMSNPRKASIAECEACGIGVLRVTDKGVVAISAAKPGISAHAAERRIRGILEHRREGGIAGKPNEKGVGPAQDVLKEVRLYKRDHPDATWEDLFGAVPNHYSSKDSMRMAMGSAEEREIYRGVIPDMILSRANKRILESMERIKRAKADRERSRKDGLAGYLDNLTRKGHDDE